MFNTCAPLRGGFVKWRIVGYSDINTQTFLSFGNDCVKNFDGLGGKISI